MQLAISAALSLSSAGCAEEMFGEAAGVKADNAHTNKY